MTRRATTGGNRGKARGRAAKGPAARPARADETVGRRCHRRPRRTCPPHAHRGADRVRAGPRQTLSGTGLPPARPPVPDRPPPTLAPGRTHIRRQPSLSMSSTPPRQRRWRAHLPNRHRRHRMDHRHRPLLRPNDQGSTTPTSASVCPGARVRWGGPRRVGRPPSELSPQRRTVPTRVRHGYAE